MSPLAIGFHNGHLILSHYDRSVVIMNCLKQVFVRLGKPHTMVSNIVISIREPQLYNKHVCEASEAYVMIRPESLGC
jgi:hypothetical protein